MCGIVAYIGQQTATDILLDGLSRLEYRGYDSAGIALIESGNLFVRKAKGKLKELRSILNEVSLKSKIGIGHTRWATHGRPSTENAHPHVSDDIAIVHNGIIENYSELKAELLKESYEFVSETDTEVLAHLLHRELERALENDLSTSHAIRHAIRQALAKVRGSYALVVLSLKDPDTLWVARQSSPLIIAKTEDEFFVASDAPAILNHSNCICYLEDGDLAELKAGAIQVWDAQAQVRKIEWKRIPWNIASAEKEGHKHFMLKEIFEQPRSITDTLAGRINLDHGSIQLDELDQIITAKFLKNLKVIHLVACGSSWHAALVAKFYLDQFLDIPVLVDYASEFRYRDKILNERSLLIAISQSGETADSLTVVKQAKEMKATVIAICNVLGSSMTRESDLTLFTRCGPEIGVAATKSFTAQILVLLLLSLKFAELNESLDASKKTGLLPELLALPGKIQKIIDQAESIRQIALDYAYQQNYLFIGRNSSYPIALEGALKLKEIAYVHAEGYAAGELKHGPIALIEEGTSIVALLSQSRLYEKVLSNVQEVSARGAECIAIVSEQDQKSQEFVQELISIPASSPLLAPILEVIPLQLFSYYIANERGLDVDQPRNLAKSVTVE